jgi:hypothetical protein
MLSKSTGVILVIVLLAIYGYSTVKVNEPKKQVSSKSVISKNISPTIQANSLFKDSFLVYQEDFNELAILLENEFENTILEAGKENFEDFVLSKNARTLLEDLDVNYVSVHTTVNNTDRATIFSLGNTWGNTTEVALAYSKTAIPNAQTLEKNWYLLPIN